MIGLAVAASVVVAIMLLLPRLLDDRYYIGPASDHYDGERFFNPGRAATSKGLGPFLRWQLSGNRAEWPDRVPVTPTKPAPRVEGETMVATVVGHAGILVQTAGLNILTDPVYSERVSPFSWMGPRRVRAPGVAFDDLPKIDVVLVSHNHYDHLDLDTLQRLWERDRPVIVTPLGNGALMARRGITAFARDWGDTVGIREDVTVTVERVQHWSTRWRYDVNRALWGGFTVATPGGSIYFAGDCGYSDAFAETARQRGPFRLALLPVGAYEPRWFMKAQHMNPAEAVQAFHDLGAETAIGIHWGVWQLTDEAIDAPRQDLAKALKTAAIAPARFPALEPGQSIAVPPASVILSAQPREAASSARRLSSR
jgi:L-ascorbate metabolism protein UlaG (beta-lactamase superfamily)